MSAARVVRVVLCLFISVIGWEVPAQTLGDALNLGNAAWTTGGDAFWAAQTNTSLDGLAAHGGPLGNNQTTWLETTVTNSGTVVFWWKANTAWWTEWPDIFHGGALQFYLNGSLSNQIKGGTDWLRQAVYCPAGTNLLHWQCSVVNSYAPGNDEGWLDEVAFFPDPSAPQILAQPQPRQKVAAGATVSFTVNALGTPPLSFQWQFQGNPVPNATNATLTLTNVLLAQAGAYNVIVTNGSGSITSSNAVLVVEPALPLSQIGQWPGFDRSQALSVLVEGNRAYVGLYWWNSYGAFLVLDVSNPAHPALLGKLEGIQGAINNLFKVGNLVYAACDVAGLAVLNVADPAHPAIVGTCGTGDAQSVKVVGHYAYVSDYSSSGFNVVDVSNPALPGIVGVCTNLFYWEQQICVSGNYAYVPGGGQGVNIIDISSPTNPVLASSIPLPGYADQVQVSGNLAFVADAWGGLQILDVSDPTQPTVVTNFPVNAYTISLVGTQAVMATDGGFMFLDMTQPTAPQQIGFAALPDTPITVQIVSNIAYVADWDSGFQVVDVSNPSQPVNIGDFDTSGSANDVDIVGNVAFLADGKAGLQILDISNPRQPAEVGAYMIPSDNGATAVKVVGHYAYIAYNSAGLQIVDVSNPAHPVFVSACPNIGAQGLDVAGNYVFVGAGFGGLQVVDISDPAQPRQLNQTNLTVGDTLVKVVGHYALLAPWYDDELMVVDISDPSQPVQVSTLPLGANIFGYFVTNNTLYTRGEIIDLSNPAQPTQIGQYNDNGFVEVVSNLAFVADGNLSVFDVSEPTLPVLVAYTNAPGWSLGSSLKAAGQYLFLCDSDWGLQVYQLPTNFVSAPWFAPGPTNFLAFAGQDFALAANAGGQPPLSYQWYWNGARIDVGTNWVLAFTNIQTATSGRYTVVVSNNAGMATNVMNLVVVVRPDILVGGTNTVGFDAAGRFRFAFRSQTNALYAVEYVNSLAQTNWSVLTNLPGTDFPVEVIDPAPPSPSRFYRVRKQ